MRVAIEAGPLTLSSGGLARYTSELSLALARCFPADEFFLLTDRPFRMPAPAPPNLKRGGVPRNAMERRWWLWGIARELDRLRIDVVHGPDFSVPYIPRRPSVMTVHDLSPWMNPGWHAAAQRVARRTPVLLEMGVANMVITPSESVRRQAMERFRLRPDRVVAIPEAAPNWLGPVRPAEAAGALGPTPYYLFVGTLEPRKNLPVLIEAWRRVRRKHQIDLVLAGRRREDCPPIVEEPGLRLLGEVGDDRLPDLYSGAVAFVYPSLYEGFGLPVLEAMQCGACVIASRAVAETGGDAAVYAESVDDLVSAMTRAAVDAGWRAEHQALSLARAGEFSWDRTARLTRQVYEEARQRYGD
jgi:glycosyltransferase involved in cell wall biosynthesis